MRLIYRLSLMGAFVTGCFPAFCQTANRLNALVSSINNIRKPLPIEKLYLQTDKDNYIQGDTIWFKAYLLNADYLLPSDRSGLLYVELDDAENTCVKRILVPLVTGISWGNMAIVENEVPAGSYTIRAYTNWMRNFGEDYIFKKSIYVAAAGGKSRLVTAAFKQTGNNIQADILLADLDNKPVRLQDMQLKVLNGKKQLFKKNMPTGVDGRLDVNLTIPENARAQNLSIAAKELIKGQETNGLTIPITINRPENTDLQFMPEGGNLVGGISMKVGFKAVGEDGKGVQVSGSIYDSKQRKVASFKAVRNGIGAFEFLPQTGEVYTARLDLPAGAAKTYTLPVVSPNGTSLRVMNAGVDSIEVKISSSTATFGDYYLLAVSRGVACYAAHLVVKDGASAITIAKSVFPTGIARFTLLTAGNQPLNERIIFINHHDEMKIGLALSQGSYAPHDSISAQILVTDKNGKPSTGTFSMAVTDDSQVKTDSLGSNMLNSFLLTSDLKGTVEEPGYYFDGGSAERAVALDDLLLTQGWVGYSWKNIFDPPAKPVYIAEPSFAINGRVTNVFNKPLAGAGIVLLSKKPALITEAVTGADGRFSFTGISPVDTAAFVIQARRKSGSSFNVGVDVDEFKPPVFTQALRQAAPWYVNSDTLLLHNREGKVSQRMAEEKILGTGTMLKEVTITDKKVIKDSKNLNGAGGADFILDEKDMEKAKKLSLYDLLLQKFPDFHKDFIRGKDFGPDTAVYYLKSHRVNFVIDGVFIKTLELQVDLYMNFLTAEDIKGIEIMYNAKYALAYNPDFIHIATLAKPKNIPIYLEITTYSGNGAFLKKVPGVAIYKPLPFSLPKQFYRPKYTAKNTITGTDQRSTIHWEPNIVTDTAGCATVSFYSADKPGTYTLIIQGTDLNGQLGWAWRKIVVR